MTLADLNHQLDAALKVEDYALVRSQRVLHGGNKIIQHAVFGA